MVSETGVFQAADGEDLVILACTVYLSALDIALFHIPFTLCICGLPVMLSKKCMISFDVHLMLQLFYTMNHKNLQTFVYILTK